MRRAACVGIAAARLERAYRAARALDQPALRRLLRRMSAVDSDALKPCPNCGKKTGQLKKSELPSRFPWRVECGGCGFATEFVRLPGVASKLWNEVKRTKAKVKRD